MEMRERGFSMHRNAAWSDPLVTGTNEATSTSTMGISSAMSTSVALGNKSLAEHPHKIDTTTISRIQSDLLNTALTRAKSLDDVLEGAAMAARRRFVSSPSRSRSCFKDSFVLRTRLQTVTKERDQLAQRLIKEQAENDSKDRLIQSLQEQIATLTLQQQESATANRGAASPLLTTASSDSEREETDRDDGPPPLKRRKEGQTSSSRISSRSNSPPAPQQFDFAQSVVEIQRWMFLQGGHLTSGEEMISRYVEQVREMLCVPLDRLFVGSLMLHPKATAFAWKWELGQPFEGQELARDNMVDQKEAVPVFSPDEPFALLAATSNTSSEGSVRMKATNVSSVPRECSWFWDGGYQDYLLLPIIHRGEFMGGVSWATKSKTGFSEEHIEFFKSSLASLSTVMRLHTNDVVMKKLMSGLEEEVADRTSDLVAANKNLEAANNRIMKQSEAIVDHFTIMSHNLLTPLNFIVGMSSLLEGSELDDSQRESVESIIRGGELLARIVNDVLDYSRLELGGGMDIAVRPTSVRDTVETVVGAMEIKAKSRSLKIRVHWNGHIPNVIQTDARRMRQILYNIISNALKFSSDGGAIDFGIRLRGEDIQFVVKDYGKGIDECDLATIFEPFSQCNEDTIGAYGGSTGLGLAICRKLVQGLGGTISVSSELGKWSEFVVSLPIGITSASDTSISSGKNEILSDVAKFETMTKAAQKPEAVETIDTNTMPLESLRLLVVDDNKVNQRILERVLQRLGVRHIDIASDGQEAVDLELVNTYQLILMDIQMPRLDGLDATKLILSRTRSAGELSPRVVFVTAHALDTFRQRALEVGGSDFVCKPINIQKIRAIFESLFPAGQQMQL